MWNIIEYPPQPFGECSVCKRHNCGEYEEDGVMKQKWLHTPIEMDKGGTLSIGYQCVKSMSDNLGITKEIIEKPIHIDPTDEHIVGYIRRSIDRQPLAHGTDPLQANIDHINGMDRAALKAYLAEQNVEFVAQWGDEKLKEAAIAHVKGAKL